MLVWFTGSVANTGQTTTFEKVPFLPKT